MLDILSQNNRAFRSNPNKTMQCLAMSIDKNCIDVTK